MLMDEPPNVTSVGSLSCNGFNRKFPVRSRYLIGRVTNSNLEVEGSIQAEMSRYPIEQSVLIVTVHLLTADVTCRTEIINAGNMCSVISLWCCYVSFFTRAVHMNIE
jgi:hypothetical protein